QVGLDFYSRGLALSRTWSKYACGQTAAGIEFCLSRNFSTGDSSCLEIFFWCLSSIAL
ncbi:hypothetical protein M569_01695, partial [Genlisea aurea]